MSQEAHTHDMYHKLQIYQTDLSSTGLILSHNFEVALMHVDICQLINSLIRNM